MPRIDHVAVETDDLDAAAAFYERVFGAKVVRAEGHPVTAYVGHLQERRRSATTLGRRRVAAHAVEQNGEEPVGKLVRVGVRPQPGVRPVRGGEGEQRRRDVVQVGA